MSDEESEREEIDQKQGQNPWGGVKGVVGLDRSNSNSSSESGDNDSSDWSFGSSSRSGSLGSFGSFGSMGSMGSLMNLGAEGAAQKAVPWWMPSKAMAVALRDGFCQALDWVVAAIMCLCWWMRPSGVSLLYGLMAAWMLVIRPQVPQLVNPSSAGTMPFPRMLRPGIAVAVCGAALHSVLRGKHGGEMPDWAADWLALTKHPAEGATAWSWTEDNGPEIVLLVSGAFFVFVWRKYGTAQAVDSLRQRSLSRRSSSRSHSMRMSSRSLSATSLAASGWVGAEIPRYGDDPAEGEGEGEGVQNIYGADWIGSDIAPSSISACCAIVDDNQCMTVRELVAQIAMKERDRRTTVVWYKGMERWVTVEELIARESTGRKCLKKCGRRGRGLCKSCVGRPSWATTLIALSLFGKRLLNGERLYLNRHGFCIKPDGF